MEEYSSIWVRDTVQKGYYTMGKKDEEFGGIFQEIV